MITFKIDALDICCNSEKIRGVHWIAEKTVEEITGRTYGNDNLLQEDFEVLEVGEATAEQIITALEKVLDLEKVEERIDADILEKTAPAVRTERWAE
jgi:hypothetical protein